MIIADADDLRALVTFITAADAAAGSDAPDGTETTDGPQCELGRFVIAARYEPGDEPARDASRSSCSTTVGSSSPPTPPPARCSSPPRRSANGERSVRK